MLLRPLVPLCIAVFPFAGVAQSGSNASGLRAPATELIQGGDHFVAGQNVRIRQPVPGDLFAAAGNVDVDAAVSGDAVVAGGAVRIAGPVGGSVYAAGGQLTLDGPVSRNARIAGGRVELGPQADVAGGVSVSGGEVRLKGAVKGYVQVAGGHAWIDGTVGGDVVATAGSLELGPNARVGGKLRYASRDPLRRDPEAQVAGGIERIEIEVPGAVRAERRVHRVLGLAWTAGLMLTAALLVAALPAFTTRVAATMHSRLGPCLLIGFAALVCIPVAVLILFVTLIGIPLAVLTLALYLALLPLAYVMGGIGIGDYVLGRFRTTDAARAGWRVGAAALAVLVLALLARVPILGVVAAFVVLVAGVGALAIQARQPAGS